MHQYWVMFDSEFGENGSGPLNFRKIWIFFIVTSNFKIYPRSFLYEEAEIKQDTSLNKERCEVREEAIWESWFTCFFILLEK